MPEEARPPKQGQASLAGPFSPYLARVYYVAPPDLSARVPELAPLRDKVVAIIGLGCLGAPSALEFAKAGIKELRLVDHDVVDPGTAVRWPKGFSAAGQHKAVLLHQMIRADYPYTRTGYYGLRIGRIRPHEREPRSDLSLLTTILTGVDLIYDATAEIGVQHFLSDWAWNQDTPYIGVAGTLGAWGGKAFRVRKRADGGCWFCYCLHCMDGMEIRDPPSAPDAQGNVQPTGCADPTFTGAGFDMLQVAMAGVRLAVSTLCEGREGAYPACEWDIIHMRLRDDNGGIVVPTFTSYRLTKHPECKNVYVDHDRP